LSFAGFPFARVSIHNPGKLENRNLGEMKRIYELDEYKPAEALSESKATENKEMVEKLGSNLNAFIKSTKA